MTRRSIWRTGPNRRRRPVSWYGSKDGIAHARLREGDARTLCGEVAILPQLAWPATTRCLNCSRKEAEL